MFGSTCEGFGAGEVSLGEFGTDEGEDRTDATEEGMGEGESATGEGGKGEVMRGIVEDGWGDKGKPGD